MRISQAILCFLLAVFCFIGCSRKQESPPRESETSPTELTLPQIPKLNLSYKPTNSNIQTALKNAGFYKGEIDGDVGPLTKQAIREFQAENNLVIDGIVGPKTWEVLAKYLPQSAEKTD